MGDYLAKRERGRDRERDGKLIGLIGITQFATIIYLRTSTRFYTEDEH